MKTAIDRLYYSITEVAKMIGEEQHVLRYWEREFSQLRPQKNRAGNRVYADKDLGVLNVIKRLLREERYTVAGAKEYLKNHSFEKDAESKSLRGDETKKKSMVAKTGALDERIKVIESLSTELRDIADGIRRSTMPNGK